MESPVSPVMLKVIAIYQYAENYGAHDWDGKGDCPQYWKMKGSQEEILFDGITIEMSNNSDFKEWSEELALTLEYYNECSSQEFIGLDFVPSNQLDRYEAMEAEMREDYEYLALFPSQAVYQRPDENDPIDRFDKLADEIGLGGL